jgi:hypothetical protein
VVFSDGSHPFAQAECLCLGMTTQRHSEGIEVATSDWRRGGAQTTSFISPWYVATIKYNDLDRQQGDLPEPIVETAVEDLHEYTSVV